MNVDMIYGGLAGISVVTEHTEFYEAELHVWMVGDAEVL